MFANLIKEYSSKNINPVPNRILVKHHLGILLINNLYLFKAIRSFHANKFLHAIA